MTLGAELGVAMGPIGRSGSASLSTSGISGPVPPIWTFAHQKGLFAGITLEVRVTVPQFEVLMHLAGLYHRS